MNCRAPNWGEIPSVALANIYEHLNMSDRLKASATCWNWRNVLFQKRFFKSFAFKLHINNDRQCSFFLKCLLNLPTELRLVFDPRSVHYVDKVKRILFKVIKTDLVGLRFQTNCAGIVTSSTPYSNREYSEIEQYFVEPIKVLLGRKVPSFKVLDLGAIEPLTLYATDFLKALARPQDLQEATFASVKYDPSHYPILKVESIFFEKCTSLQVLSLDYDALTDDFLQTLQILPLKKFMICVHGLDETHAPISESAWATFNRKFKNIDLILTLISAYEAVEVLDSSILRRSMPITHLRVLFCNSINLQALDLMSTHFKDTLKSIQWIDSAYQQASRNTMDLYFHAGQDPFVMMSWRCKNLEEIVIHGYVLDPHNLVGVSRLCGRNLKKLEVSMLDQPSMNDMMSSFIEEISTQLGHKWKPLDSTDIHPALSYMPITDDIRDEYVMDIIRSDLVN